VVSLTAPETSRRRSFGLPEVSGLVLFAAVARGWNQLAPVTTDVRIASWLGNMLETGTGPWLA
jgi:hypothetical protein